MGLFTDDKGRPELVVHPDIKLGRATFRTVDESEPVEQTPPATGPAGATAASDRRTAGERENRRHRPEKGRTPPAHPVQPQ